MFDGRADADAALAALADAGLGRERVIVLEGDDGARVFDTTGRQGVPFGRITRLVQFTLSDQMPDFAWYEASLREGRTVVGVSAAGREVRDAVRVLRENGGHFINRFGLFVTEEFARWRGPEPALPEFLRR